MGASTTAEVILLQRIVDRDQVALAELYDKHGRLVFSLALRILRSQCDAEEVLQEVFVRVWTRAATYDERLGSPAAWLTRIARNLAIDRLRSVQSRGEVMSAIPEVASEVGPAAPGPTSAGALPDVLLVDSIRSAMDSLPAAQRQVIEAAFFDGYTHQELAERFALPLGTVKTRIRTGLMTLRQRLEHAV